MNHNVTRKVVAAAAGWLGRQDYLRSFQVHVDPHVVVVSVVANNFVGQVYVDVEPFLSGEKDVEWGVIEQLEPMGAEIRRKLAHVADPARLPG